MKYKQCIICGTLNSEDAKFCSNCGGCNCFSDVYNQTFDYTIPVNGNFGQMNNQMENTQVFQANSKRIRSKMPIRIGKFFAGIVVLLIMGLIISSFDSQTSQELIGTWSHSQLTKTASGFSVDIVYNLEMKEKTFRWYIDEEKTKENLTNTYFEVLSNKGITDEDVKEKGYCSLDDFVEDSVNSDLKDLVKIYNEDPENSGTWRIYNNEFIFKYSDGKKEFKTSYRVDGDVLELRTDGITLKKVK